MTTSLEVFCYFVGLYQIVHFGIQLNTSNHGHPHPPAVLAVSHYILLLVFRSFMSSNIRLSEMPV